MALHCFHSPVRWGFGGPFCEPMHPRGSAHVVPLAEAADGAVFRASLPSRQPPCPGARAPPWAAANGRNEIVELIFSDTIITVDIDHVPLRLCSMMSDFLYLPVGGGKSALSGKNRAALLCVYEVVLWPHCLSSQPSRCVLIKQHSEADARRL